jgi:hypothetical protein
MKNFRSFLGLSLLLIVTAFVSSLPASASSDAPASVPSVPLGAPAQQNLLAQDVLNFPKVKELKKTDRMDWRSMKSEDWDKITAEDEASISLFSWAKKLEQTTPLLQFKGYNFEALNGKVWRWK